jgi:signal transduction histidine kinase
MSLKFSLTIPYFLLLLFMAGLAGYFMGELALQKQLIEETTQQASIVSTHALAMTNLREKLRRLLLLFTFGVNDNPELLREITQVKQQQLQLSTTLSEQITTREGRRLIENHVTALATSLEELSRFLGALEQQDPALGRRHFFSWDFQTRYARYTLSDLQVYTAQSLDGALSRIDDLRHGIEKAMLVAAAFFILVVGGSVWYVRHKVLERLWCLKQDIIRIGSGNFDQPVLVDGKDELADLARTFDQLRGDLQAAQIQIRQSRDELKELNAQLEKRVEERTLQLEAANRELEAFSYSVSHDLKAPLRGIEGFAGLLGKLYQDRLDEQGRDYLRRVQASAVRMGHLIEDLLHLSRITRQKKQIEIVNLSELVQQIATEIHAEDPSRDLNLTVQDNLLVKGDSGLLRVALENLLANAFKFTSNSKVTMIQFGQKLIDGDKVFFLSDNGAGFNQAYVHKLFIPFQRLHQSHEFPGTGIGLATVQRIIRLHGGHIWAEGAEDQGATFYFTLSAQEEESQHHE